MAETAAAIDRELDKIIPKKKGLLENLMDSLRYSAIGGGKRLRPFLTMQTAFLFSAPKSQALCVATAIELVHCYSLVHDDLPAMDNDDWRRGKPTNHKVFGDGLAVLAGDGLLTLAFEILNSPKNGIGASARSELTLALAKSAGITGMIGGQAMDIQAQHQSINPSEIRHLQALKTGALIGFAVDAGAVLGAATRQQRDALKAYATSLGAAFQIIDDLLDIEGNASKVGKILRKDTHAGKATLVGLLGVNEARSEARKMTDQALINLKNFDEKADRLREIAQFLFDRNH